jgi:surfactin family lipopeptide synthetase A
MTLLPSREASPEAMPSVQSPAAGASREDVDVFLASYAQQRLWFLDQLVPHSAAYNVAWAWRLEGPLEPAALAGALGAIVARHEALRTTFAAGADGIPQQVIHPPAPVAVPLDDLSGRSAAERAGRAELLVREEAERPFDLARGPLLRARLVRLGAAEHLFLLTIHHIAFDGWSAGVFHRELARLYAGLARGEAVELEPLPIQYADFAVWQRGALAGERLAAEVGYWRERLAGAPAVLELPGDYPRPARRSARGATCTRRLGPALLRGLQELSRREGVTLFMTLLAAFQVLLRRYTGQTDLVVGTPIANRTRQEIEPLIGFFVNLLALRTDLGGDPSFREVLGRVREVCLGAYAHQDLPFEKLVEELAPTRDLSRAPLVQVTLALQNTAGQTLELAGLGVRDVSVEGGARFDLGLSLAESAEGLLATAEYSTDLFRAATIERLLGHFATLLDGVVADPERRVGELPLLGPAERRQLLVDWNATARPYPAACLHELFAAQAARTPEAVAVVCGEERLSYRELDARANQLAHYLQARGVGPETLVALGAARVPALVVGVLGILKAGGAYVPLDPAYPPERRELILADTQAPLLLTSGDETALAGSGTAVVRLDRDWAVIAGAPTSPPPSAATPQHLAYVIYTSGSTGRPKGVAIEHHSVVNLVTGSQELFTIGPGDRLLQFASLNFDVSVWEIFTALLSGATLVLGPAETLHSPPELAQLMSVEGITVADLPPAILAHLPPDCCPTLRISITGMESFAGELINRWARPGRRIFNGYGPTEATVVVTFQECSGRTWEHSPPIGRPMANQRVYLLDEWGQPVPIGVPGELYLGGVGLARGYLHRPELTAQKFLPDPFVADGTARLYRTGDRARYLADGSIEFLGRLDQQVKVRGYRIEPGEIEAALRRHPALQEAVVVAREDVPGEKRLVAYVAVGERVAPSARELRDFLGQTLPGYMIPAAFVALERLPLTPGGKVDQRALPAPTGGRAERGGAYVAPRTPLEAVLAAEVYAVVLGVPEVGIEDSFFDLGGHSLQATQVISRVRDRFGVELPLRALFEAPTIAALALRIEASSVTLDPNDAELRLLAEIEQLSEDEVQKELEAERQAGRKE